MEEKVFERVEPTDGVSENKVVGAVDLDRIKEEVQPTQTVDEIESLINKDTQTLDLIEKELAKAKVDLEAMKLDYLRAVADAENIRRRSEENVQKAYKFSIEKFSKELLPVLDSLEAALMHAGTGDVAREGVECTQAQLLKALENNDVKACCPSVGDRFDPHAHQAMAAVACSQEPNSIVSVMQRGYLLKERVLRPALVTVAKSDNN